MKHFTRLQHWNNEETKQRVIDESVFRNNMFGFQEDYSKLDADHFHIRSLETPYAFRVQPFMDPIHPKSEIKSFQALKQWNEAA